MVTGRGARDAPRLAAAPNFGADLVVDVDERDPVDALRAATGGLADVVVDVTAKAPAAFGAGHPARAHGRHDRRGRHPRQRADARVRTRPGRLQGAAASSARSGSTPSRTRAALDLLAARRFPFEDLLRRVAGFDTMPALLRDMAGEGDPPPVHAVFSPSAP